MLFLEKYNEPPKQSSLKYDSANAIIHSAETDDWEDGEILSSYLQKIQVTNEDYRKFTEESVSFDGFSHCEYLNMYANAFLKLPQTVKSRNSNAFKKLTVSEQSEKLKQEFYSYAKPIEFEKLFYFALTYKQTVFIVTAPNDNDGQKRFLGYYWSDSKGYEGIHITQAGGMLYNETDRNADDTIASSIRSRFSGTILPDLGERQQYCTLANLSDMIDFSRITFNKAIKLTPDKKIEIRSKYPLVKLGNIAEVSSGNSAPQDRGLFVNGKYPFFRTSDIGAVHLHKSLKQTTDYLNDKGVEKLKKYPKGTILMPKSGVSTYLNHRVIMGVDGYVVSHLATIIANNEKIITEFLYEFLVLVDVQDLKVNSDYPSLNKSDIDNIKIPLPPLDIQRQIVSECEKIDEEYNTSRMSIEEYKKKISQVFENLEVIVKTGGGVKR